MSITSYAQNFEDVMLWRALHDVETGSYLDIGAQDPVIDSVSLAFYQNGWRGIHVEPNPEYATLLRAARPDEPVIEAAACSSIGTIEFYAIEGTGLSTGCPQIAERHKGLGFESRKLLVPTVRLDSLFEQFETLHWLKIDVEGMEAEVLGSWGDHPMRPWIILVEATKPLEQVRSDISWRSILFERNYKEVYFDGLNRYFLHVDQARRARRLRSPPSVFDGFRVSSNHFAIKDLAAKSDADRENAANKLTELNCLLESSEARLSEQKEELESVRYDLALANQEKNNLFQDLERTRLNLLLKSEEIAIITAEYASKLEKLVAENSASAEIFAQKLRKIEENHSAERADLIAAFKHTEATYREGELRLRNDHAQREAELSTSLANVERSEALFKQKIDFTRLALRRALSIQVKKRDLLAQLFGLTSRDQIRSSLQTCLLMIDDAQVQYSENFVQPLSIINRNPYLRANSLPELLSWDDVDFVRCAYVTILGRQPDREGEFHFTSRLRMGDSKVTILWQLRRSSEGSNHDPGIAGLDRTLKREALRRIKLFGWLIRAILSGEGVSKHDRRSRQILNRLALINNDQLRQLTAVSNVQMQVDDISSKLAAIADQICQLSGEANSQDSASDQSHSAHGPILQRDKSVVKKRQLDELDTSSRERAVFLAIQQARY